MTNCSHYFGAGPAALPSQVKQRIQQDFLQYKDTRVSILELSHRSEAFAAILDDARNKLRALYAIPDNYHIIFMAGGATAQFDAIPLNLMGAAEVASYVETGFWSLKAAQVAEKHCKVQLVPGLQEDPQRIRCIKPEALDIHPDAAYIHVTPNETIEGVEFSAVKKHHTVVADMTSCLLMRPININDYGLIYAGAQKTLGIAGITIVIIRDDLLDKAAEHTPVLYRYDAHVEYQSIVNTSPVFACYVTQLVLNWVTANGGIEAMYEQAHKRSQLLYRTIDSSSLILNPIDPENRSSVNVVFDFADASKTQEFLAAAQTHGLDGLSGHRLKGGVRVSMYNGTPISAVEQLNQIMQNYV